MISFDEYQQLRNQSLTRAMTGRENRQAFIFLSKQPKNCPKCGALVLPDDPLSSEVFHDVVKCEREGG